MWPKFEDQKAGLNLAFIGSINDEILDREELALELIRFLEERYPQSSENRYPGVEGNDGDSPSAILEQIARVRACLLKGGVSDNSKAASILLDDFRSGRLGRITLELPPVSAQ